MQCENVSRTLSLVKMDTLLKSCEAAATIVTSVGIIQRVANNLDT